MKKSRRWRARNTTQYATTYELDCLFTDRVALVRVGLGSFSWGIYPVINGKAQKYGEAMSPKAAKIEARKALDTMAKLTRGH